MFVYLSTPSIQKEGEREGRERERGRERQREREREKERESTHETVEVGTLVGVFTYKVGTKLRSGNMPGSPLQRWHLNALKHILEGLGGGKSPLIFNSSHSQ